MSGKNKDQTENKKTNLKVICAIAAIAIILIASIYFYSTSIPKLVASKAAIIDQLGSSELGATIREANQTFVEDATNLLQQRFTAVDYYQDNATVAQYMHLASSGYAMIVWRAHSALDLNGQYIALATTDKYPFVNYNDYLDDDRLTLCNITGDETLYFGITPTFIKLVMDGTFQDTVIFLMSCNGLNSGYLKTAQAFQEKGARVVISWDNWISSIDNDGAADTFLHHLIDENDTIGEAVSKMPQYSPDYGWAQLKYYPQKPETSDYYLPDYRKQGANQATVAAILPAIACFQAETNERSPVLKTSRAWINQPFETP